MNTISKTVIGLCSLVLLAPALVQAQEAKLFYAQGHSNAGPRHSVIVVNDGHHDQHRGRGHNEQGNGHGYGHNNGHHDQHGRRGHDEHGNGHGNAHGYGHHEREHHHAHHENHYYGHETHGTRYNYNRGPEIERIYVNPQIFR